MKILLSLLLFSYGYRQRLNAADFEIWRFEKKHFLLIREPKDQYLISKHCIDKKNSCKALETLKENKKYTLKKDVLSGGKNPGAIVCSEILKENVLILSDSFGSEASFCQFTDGSLISTQAPTKLL